MTKIPDPYEQSAPNIWHDVTPGAEASSGIVRCIIEIPMGSSNKYELDKQTGLLKRMIRYATSAVGRVPTQIDYSDYRPVNGVMMPFSSPASEVTTLKVEPGW